MVAGRILLPAWQPSRVVPGCLWQAEGSIRGITLDWGPRIAYALRPTTHSYILYALRYCAVRGLATGTAYSMCVLCWRVSNTTEYCTESREALYTAFFSLFGESYNPILNNRHIYTYAQAS